MQPVRKGSAMLSKRSNGNTQQTIPTADACFQAMIRHHGRNSRTPSGPKGTPPPIGHGGSEVENGRPASPPSGRDIEGDIVYGARAIAKFIFGDASDTARRRVFNLWAFHQQREERAGFFKMKGGVCLSKSQWRTFHGLD
jgi:hypothetical protein